MVGVPGSTYLGIVGGCIPTMYTPRHSRRSIPTMMRRVDLQTLGGEGAGVFSGNAKCRSGCVPLSARRACRMRECQQCENCPLPRVGPMVVHILNIPDQEASSLRTIDTRSDGRKQKHHLAHNTLTHGVLPGVTLDLSNLSSDLSPGAGVTMRRGLFHPSHLWEKGRLRSLSPRGFPPN